MTRRKGVPKWATDLLVQLGCFNICGWQTALSPQGCQCVWSKGPGLFSKQNNPGAGNNQREERKNLQVHALVLTSLCFELDFANRVQDYRLMLFNRYLVLHCFSPWFPCSHQAGVDICSECTGKQAGASGRADRRIGWLHQNYLHNVCWTVGKTNLHIASCGGKALDPLESLSHQLPTCLLYIHILWLVLKHLAFILQHMSFIQALMHLSSQINVREELLIPLDTADLLMQVS